MIQPSCDESRCFANVCGSCRALSDNNFHGKPCPFYKDRDKTQGMSERVTECLKYKLDHPDRRY